MIRVGQKIGSYEVIRQLGEGGFSRTFEARHLLLDERACLKVGRPDTDRDLLLREAKILWNLHHPSLPTLRDVLADPESGHVILAMRYVEGTALNRLAPMDRTTALQVLGRLLRALKVLHHKGIVHGDVKPTNVIVEPDRHGVVLVDLGLAAVRPDSSSRPIGWTDGFAAPETLRGAPPLPESDLYALGMTLMFALGASIKSRVLPTGIPNELLELLVALTRKDLDQRPRWGKEDPLEWFDRVFRMLEKDRDSS